MIGAIADDFTGGTDVAVAFRREGLRTHIFFGVPPDDVERSPSDAVVIALKSRMTPAPEAVQQSLDALRWLREHGADQIYFKYCSTFDSTPDGNIGPVLDALTDAIGAATVITTPSSPEHLRTQYQGYLFVDMLLLSDSHMRNHPVTPMTDSYLPRLLRTQTDATVGLIPHATVKEGTDSITAAIAAAETRAEKYILVDAVDQQDLQAIGRAIQGSSLTAGAAGLAGGLAAAVAAANSTLVGNTTPAQAGADREGRAAVLAGSCSARTLEQIAVMKGQGRPWYQLDAMVDDNPETLAADALAWYDALTTSDAPLIYSSLNPVELKRVQDALGIAESAAVLENATGRIAIGLVERGVTRIVAAGGETSGAIVTALDVSGGLIGSEAAPGVPWILTTSGHRIALLLKSGNFGGPELLADASAHRSDLA
ncbi:3-oxo-tetronate kinase [Rhodococcus sp. ACPA1]|uniref:3-oxo-tetronate kinase n=1 Tax=Rhodococcus sp. ACPA1 TaxID=2028572 RepID=UPI000BB0E1C9|nr:3-oxo-tetronate kinase [Rhodococcus sp. ACPA1]PBC51783.1 Hrp-dependent type III effector protein [Rhodococcus sp. ACPA1]